MSLFKRIDGRVRDDVFTNTIPSGYIVSPLNRFSLTGTALELQHDNLDDVLVLVDITGACAVEVTADYTPTEVNDNGGLILFNNATQTSEFLERVDAATAQTVSRWRTKSTNGKDWDFYADSGNGFNFIDSALEFTPKKAGVVLKKGTGAGFVPLSLKRITITTGDTLLVGNVTDGQTVELLDDKNAVVASSVVVNGLASLMMPRLLVTGKLRVKSGSTVVEELSGTFAGGDRYDGGASLKIVKDATTKEELSVTDLSDLGLMVNGVLQKKLYLYNPSSTAALSVNVSIAAYTTAFGYQWADVAKDASGSADTYGDVINYPSVAAGATVAFWIRVVQGSDYSGLDPLKFNIELQHA